MCTLIVMSRRFPDTPLLVAANRDERLDRPSAPPRIWSDRRVPVFAPVDLRAQGTWLGINRAGLFAGVTNRFGSTPPHPERRSRGLLVTDALEESDDRSAFERMAKLEPALHNRHHLLLADREQAFLIWSDGETRWTRELEPGVHLLTERSLGAASGAREGLLRERLEALTKKQAPTTAFLAGLLSIHADDPFDGTCVHAPAFDYGTRSSSIILMGGAELRYLHAEGPPCRTEFEEVFSGFD